jgi:hypothetical protein
MGAPSPSVNSSSSPAKPATPGSSAATITWRSGSPQGDPEPFHIEETDTSFAIDWKGHYRIAGEAFIYTDRDTGRITTVLGYPTDKLA